MGYFYSSTVRIKIMLIQNKFHKGKENGYKLANYRNILDIQNNYASEHSCS